MIDAIIERMRALPPAERARILSSLTRREQVAIGRVAFIQTCQVPVIPG